MPEHGFQSIGHVLHNIDTTAMFARLTAATEEAATPESAPDPECSRCRDVGLLRRNVAANHPEFGWPIECPCGLLAARRRLRIWEASQIPVAFQRFTLDSYAERSERYDTVAMLRAWQGGNRWLVLVGDIGVGKSGIAASLLLDWMRSGQSGLYLVTPTFLSRLRATYRESGDAVDELTVLASVISVPLLVLDDVGTARLSEWGQEKLYTVINERAAAGRRTILTSNLLASDGALEAHIGPRTWDRIRGNADVLELKGESLR